MRLLGEAFFLLLALMFVVWALAHTVIDVMIFPFGMGDALNSLIAAKKEKVERFLEYSAQCGTLESHSPATGGAPQKDEIVTQIEQLEWVSHSERDPRRYVDFDKVLTILHNKREGRE